ncbi:MAG: FG-GAP-like repeat-containing protein [candidate division WOR-3 bacterium]|nr:FG-GAP-like repeat-containing protein [candidate division WOR-3 bacterium]
MWAYLALVCLLEVFNPISGVGLDQCHGTACVDIDRDGLYDVIIASDSGVYYYHNDGSGNFTSSSPIRLYSDPANAVFVGELVKDDGYLDLLVATPEENRILVNTGNDTNFNPILLGETEVSHAAALVDFDLDGDLDIFVAGEASRLYRNDQDSFAPIQSFPKGFAVSFADYNSDGRPDFALAAEDSVLFYASPGFTLDTAIGAVAPRGLCWLDCNADNMLDLAVADSAGPNLLIKRTTSGFVSQEIDTVNAPSVAVAAGHFWGEPGADLLFINHGTADHLFRGSLNGEFSTSPDDTVSFENNNQGRAVALADLDRKNGIDAVVVGSPENAIYLSDVTSINKVTVNLKGRRDLAASLSNTMAAGALLRLYENGDLCGFWEIQAGSGHAGQDAPQKILPLPTTTGHLLTIQWPRSGVIDSIPLDTFTLPVLIDACEDITPPLPPESLRCTSHDSLSWSNDSNVRFEWNAAQDPHGSGIAGYSVLWSKDTLAYPDDEVETSDTLMTDSTDLEGDSCFFFISSVDSVGNVSAPLRYAPLKLDFHPPDSIELIHPSPYSYLNDTFVRYEWSAGVDTLSGIGSYSMEVSNRHDFLGRKADSLLDTRDTFYQSAANLGEMWHYWRLTVKDAAGNTDTMPSQQNDTLGIPFNVDVTAPVVVMRGVIPQPGDTAATNTNIIVQFSEPMLPGLARADTNYILQQNNMDVPFTVDSLDLYRFMLDPTTLL